jgi:hypothetical protein
MYRIISAPRSRHGTATRLPAIRVSFDDILKSAVVPGDETAGGPGGFSSRWLLSRLLRYRAILESLRDSQCLDLEGPKDVLGIDGGQVLGLSAAEVFASIRITFFVAG